MPPRSHLPPPLRTLFDPRRLASLLKKYGVRSAQIRIGDRTVKGYSVGGVNGFHDAWKRYLPNGTRK